MNPLEITDGEGKIVTHDNGDVTIVPTHTSDADAADLAKLTGDDVAQALNDQAANSIQAEPTGETTDEAEKAEAEKASGKGKSSAGFTG